MTASPSLPIARGLPGVGSSIALLNDPLGFLRQEVVRLGPVFGVRAATRRFTVLAGPEANDYLSRAGRATLLAGPIWRRLTVAEYGSQHNVVALDGEAHGELRHAMRHALSKAQLEACAARVMAVADRTCAPLRASAMHGTAVPVSAFTRLLVSRVVHQTVTRGTEDPIDAALSVQVSERFRWETNARMLGKWPAVVLRAPAHRARVRRVDRFAERLIARARAGHTSPWGELGLRLHEQFSDRMSAGDLRLHFLFPFVAGADTVAATLGLWLYEVLRDPHTLNTLQVAVDEVYEQHAAPTDKQLRACTPLLGSVLETLRLYPAAFGVYRQAGQDFDFAGHRVARGTEVMAFTTAGHFDPDRFPQPRRFDIRRLTVDDNPYRQKNVFMPYGVGPHICLGAALGETMLLRLAAHLLRHFDLVLTRVPAGRPYTFDPSLTPHPRLAMRAVRER